jgi:hypothetical protein
VKLTFGGDGDVQRRGMDRGELHMHREQYEPSPAMPAQQFLAPRRGFLPRCSAEASVPAAAELEAPSLPERGSEYRGESHQPESTLSSTNRPIPVPGRPCRPSNPRSRFSTMPLSGWDAPSAAWGDPEPSYAALLAPETAPAIEPEALSDLQWLPASEAPETSYNGGNDER